MDPSIFYQTLSPLEQAYWHRLETLFQQVQPQHPERGIRALILRARQEAETQEISLETALEQMFQGATERTLRRVALLQQCSLPKHPQPEV